MKTAKPYERLLELEDGQEQENIRVRLIKRDTRTWDEQTEALRGEFTARCHSHPEELDKTGRPIKGTQSAKLQDKIVKRRSSPPPKAEELAAAISAFHAAEGLAKHYRLENFETIVAGFEPDVEDITVRAIAAFEMLAGAMSDYRALFERVREFTVETPGLDGQAITHDPRVEGWAKLAAEALDEPLTRPGLTALGAYQLDEIRKNSKVAADA